jgi:hypothetical protein
VSVPALNKTNKLPSSNIRAFDPGVTIKFTQQQIVNGALNEIFCKDKNLVLLVLAAVFSNRID